MGFSFSGLRLRLLLLVLLAVVAALGPVMFTFVEQRRLAVEDARDDARRLARVAAAEHAQLIDGARQLLVGLAHVDRVYFRVAVETRQLPTQVTRRLALLDEVLASRSR